MCWIVKQNGMELEYIMRAMQCHAIMVYNGLGLGLLSRARSNSLEGQPPSQSV
jgi:hypothetical protein